MAAANASVKGFHDQIKGMFNAGPATSTNSLPYMLENSLNATEDLASEQKKHNKLALKIMEEQTKLLKKIAANDNGGLSGLLGGAASVAGGNFITKLFTKLFGNTRIGKVLQVGIGRSITQSLGGIVKKAGGAAVASIAQHAKAAFSVVAAVGRNIFAPLSGLRGLLSSSGVMKVFTSMGGVLKIFPRLLGKLFLPITAIMGLMDSVSGWTNADSILGKTGSSFGDKVSAAIGSAINGLLLGVPDWIVGKLGGGNTSQLLAKGKDKVIGGLSALGSGIGNLVGAGLKSIVSGDLKERAYATFEVVKNAVWDGLTSLATGIKDALTGVFSDMWGALKDWWNGDRKSPPNFAGRGKPAVTANGGTAQAPSTSFRTTATPSSAQQISYTSGVDSPYTSTSVGPATGTGGGIGVQSSSARQSASAGSILGDSSSTAGPSSGVVPIKTVQRGSTALPEGVDNYTQASKADINTVLINRLKTDFNLTDEQAAGMAGNFAHESAGYKAQQEYNPLGGGRGGLGFAQWTGPRRRQLEAFANERGQSPTSFETQYSFLKHELTNTPEKKVLDKLRQTTNVRDATTVFEQGYERAGVKHYDSRILHAEQALKEYNSNPVTKAPSDGTLPTAIGDVKMTNQNAKRNEDINPVLKSNIRNAVTQMFGEDYGVEVYSGSQSATSRGRTGSNRHNDGNAGDVRITDPKGNPISDQQAADLAQYWLAKNNGSVGLRMQGGGIHLDNFTNDKLGKGQARIWNYDSSNYFPDALRKQAATGLQGKMPANMRYTDEQMAALQNKGQVSVSNRYGEATSGLGALVSGKEKRSIPTITSADMSTKKNVVDTGSILNTPSSFDFKRAETKASSLPTYDSLISPKATEYTSPMPTPPPVKEPAPAASSTIAGDAGAKRVAEIPAVDEMQMLLVNGSRIT